MLKRAPQGFLIAFARRKSLRCHGFTLIEILIVISIIALLSSLILVAVNKARKSANEAIVKTEVSSLAQALEQYLQEESEYPGVSKKIAADVNQFPDLYNALFGERRPNGPGGRSAPYMKIEEKKVVVWDNDTDMYVPCTREQLRNPKVPKYLVDPWGNPYIYRANKGRKREDYMHNVQAADVYSVGPNGKDDTAEGSEDNDDIGNW